MTMLVIAAIAGVLLYAWQVEPRLLQRKQLLLKSDKVQNTIRILFVSDFHFTWFTSGGVTRQNLAKLKRLHSHQAFDLIILGGDYLDRNNRSARQLEWFCHELKTFGVPIYAVLGNHDTRFRGVSKVLVTSILEKYDVQILEDESRKVTIGDSTLLLIGLKELESCQEYLEGRFFIQSPSFYRRTMKNITWYQTQDTVSPELLRVLVSHNPDALYLEGEKRPDLQLSGHTHGGQIFFLTWLGLLLNQFNPHGSHRSWSGTKKVDETMVAVSNGFGVGLLPFRLGCPPGVYMVTLQPEPAAK